MNYYQQIKFLVMDVDGTLTDGKIYMDDDGEMLKAFNIKDGCGIKEILPQHGIVPVIITARSSKLLVTRCAELAVTELHQGCRDKISILKQVIDKYSEQDGCQYTFAHVAYIGDDIMDIQCMKAVGAAGGLAVCPADATKAVQGISNYICLAKCSDGAVREFIEWLVALRTETAAGLQQIKELSSEAFNFITGFCPSVGSDGKYEFEGGASARVMTYITKPAELTNFEAHKAFIDVQFVLYGTELIVTQDVFMLHGKEVTDYNEKKDTTLFDYSDGKARILCAGEAIVLYPEDAHRGAIAIDGSMRVRKIVVKVPVMGRRKNFK